MVVIDDVIATSDDRFWWVYHTVQSRAYLARSEQSSALAALCGPLPMAKAEWTNLSASASLATCRSGRCG